MMDVIIIGAGAAGLMAAKKLSSAGLKVSIIEARDRIGGRINSFSDSGGKSYEGGAEFIHGKLDETLQLLKEAGIEKQELLGEVWQVKNRIWSRENEFFKHVDEVIEKLEEIEEDISIDSFLAKFFAAPEFKNLRESLTSYIEGYYSAETSKISSKSFLRELLSEDEQQYRPVGGYGEMVQYMQKSITEAGGVFQLSIIVKEIRWEKGHCEIIDNNNTRYVADKVIVTVPLGVWTADEHSEGHIVYIPALPVKKEAAKQMGFGAVIKVLLKFKEDFYHNRLLMYKAGINLSEVQMIITDELIPTWWTQHPEKETLLTGWLSGPAAEKMKGESDEAILSKSLESIKDLFNVDVTSIAENLEWSKVFNWTTDPYTRGSYSYSTLYTSKARTILAEPVEDTLFFAGEGLYSGPEMGTVEAALTSGKDVASTILRSLEK